MIDLGNGISLDCDERNWVLVEAFTAITKAGEKVERTRVLGYFPDIRWAARFIARDAAFTACRQRGNVAFIAGQMELTVERIVAALAPVAAEMQLAPAQRWRKLNGPGR